MIVGWTGHRPDLFGDAGAARQALARHARHLVEHESATHFVVGGQRGVDTWAALEAVTLRVSYAVILPCPIDQFVDATWTPGDRATLEQLLTTASDVDIADGYAERNRRVATSVDLLVAVWTGTGGGGTAETLSFARAAATPVREVRLEAAASARTLFERGI